MRLEWIDDILAVLDCGSLARAAEKRSLTQSAFTRRVRLIEDNIGTELFDRRRKPVSLMPGVQELEIELRELSTRLHKLRHSLKTASDQASKPLSFVCQHALTATISPEIVRILTDSGETSVRVRSGNQDECLLHLISKEVDFAIMYAVPDDRMPEPGNAFETKEIGADTLIPVCAPTLRAKANDATIPTISYPPEVFLGQVFSRTIAPRLPKNKTLMPRAETALTLAMLQYAVNEIGIAWLPLSLVATHLTEDKLVCVDDVLPTQSMSIRMVRLAEAISEQDDQIWQHLNQHLSF
ncbi:LysR family transcriptional regulator [Phaeobacter gallaeciensis]|uniref:LysR family transcriptional regulator n=2 Tax=Roseobacteraceae TaxID=2854170 RepID=A0A366WU70_9RHOB|nr:MULTISPECIES: LysR substrate-binding domain-containing protein [Roseobacteraceae]MBT3143769.1 LysR family transcriptional regulator [Falsiruegeria litorea]RBW53525.1 LysR family transcriptional regulator [Phaeobacter gallaeciensis]